MNKLHQVYNKRSSHADESSEGGGYCQSRASQWGWKYLNIFVVNNFLSSLIHDLDTLDPHDEPANIAGELGHQGEDGDDVVVVPGHHEHTGHERQSGQHHAQGVNPPPTIAIHQILTQEHWGKLSEGQETEVSEDVPGEILSVEWPSHVEIVIDCPDQSHGHKHSTRKYFRKYKKISQKKRKYFRKEIFQQRIFYDKKSLIFISQEVSFWNYQLTENSNVKILLFLFPAYLSNEGFL